MTTTSAMYSGKKEGLTFEKFDDMVISWGREKYGDKYANALWKNELLSLGSLDLTDDFVWHQTPKIRFHVSYWRMRF